MRGDTRLPAERYEQAAQRWAREAEEAGLSIVPTAKHLAFRRDGVSSPDALRTFHRALYLFEQLHGREPRREH